jgi:hypothetical protein
MLEKPQKGLKLLYLEEETSSIKCAAANGTK